MPFVASTPKPPYYAVVFTSINADVDQSEHVATNTRMMELASRYDGYLGIESARSADRTGITVSYWRDMESIAKWARNPEHIVAKRNGREIWYTHYMLRICKVEREYGRPDGE